MKYFINGLLILVLGTITAQAQDYERIEPKLPSELTEWRESGAGTGGGAAQSSAGSGQQLLANLRGLLFVDSQSKVRSSATGVSGVSAPGIDLLQSSEFQSVMQPYIGRPLTMGSLERLNRDVVLFYERNNKPVVDVIVPEQDITGGVVQIVVLEGKVGRVVVEGNQHFSSDLLLSQVHVETGQTVDTATLMKDLDWLNQNPFRQVDLVYTGGSSVGEVDVVLRTQDRFPVRVYGGYENTGNDLTSENRFIAGFNWGNVAGTDHRLNYQFTFGEDLDLYKAHSFSYIAPLRWRHTLMAFGSYVRTHGDFAAPIDLQGKSWQMGLRYSIPLPPAGAKDNWTHDVSFGFDFKSTNNNFEFGGHNVFDNKAEVNQFVVGYHGLGEDPNGVTTVNINFYISPGGITDKNNNTYFDGVRSGATADYFYTRFDIQRVHRLPQDFSLVLRGTAQISNSNLIGSEQLGVGGYGSVRGYEEREANGDDGFLATVEVRSPSFSLNSGADSAKYADGLQFHAFFDYGNASLESPLPDEVDDIDLASVGIGATYRLSNYLSIRADYGWQLEDNVSGSSDDGRGHIGVILSY